MHTITWPPPTCDLPNYKVNPSSTSDQHTWLLLIGIWKRNDDASLQYLHLAAATLTNWRGQVDRADTGLHARVRAVRRRPDPQ